MDCPINGCFAFGITLPPPPPLGDCSKPGFKTGCAKPPAPGKFSDDKTYNWIVPLDPVNKSERGDQCKYGARLRIRDGLRQQAAAPSPERWDKCRDDALRTLSVLMDQKDGTWLARQNFQNNNIQHQMAGIAVTNRHPYHALIERAMLWVHNSGLVNPLQSVLPPATNASAETHPTTTIETSTRSDVTAPAQAKLIDIPFYRTRRTLPAQE